MNKPLFALFMFSLPAASFFARPVPDVIELSPIEFSTVMKIPYQLETCDSIFTGTVVSNNVDNSSVFAVEETLFGHATSANIIVRHIRDSEIEPLVQDKKYLIFAFTNNWGYSGSEDEDAFIANLYYHRQDMTTNAVPSNGYFDDYRIIDSKGSAYDFSMFSHNGTSYWPDARTFITNFLEITRVQHSETNAYMKIDSTLGGKPGSELLPRWMISHLLYYYWDRYHSLKHVKKYVPDIISE